MSRSEAALPAVNNMAFVAPFPAALAGTLVAALSAK